MQFQEKNKIIIAVAGSGKTTSLVRDAIKNSNKKILFLTYTNENLANIKKTFKTENKFIPDNVEIKTWFSFLLRDGVRPYHNYVSSGSRVASIHFIDGSSSSVPFLRFLRESDTERFYFDTDRRIYTDKISQYVCKCNDSSSGLVIKRLEEIYDQIYIDEVQDLAGWDLEFLELLLESRIEMTLVGDPRQVIYSTNHSLKNSNYRDEKIIDFFNDLKSRKMCEVINVTTCHRCNQSICDMADIIFPSLEKSQSTNKEKTGHDGVFPVTKDELTDYIKKYNPALLRHDARSKTHGKLAMNFGTTKGLTFERVLIFPTEDMKKFFNTKDANHVAKKTKAKLYVAITRAKYSVAFVND